VTGYLPVVLVVLLIATTTSALTTAPHTHRLTGRPKEPTR
jgi:hypothetical protein